MTYKVSLTHEQILPQSLQRDKKQNLTLSTVADKLAVSSTLRCSMKQYWVLSTWRRCLLVS